MRSGRSTRQAAGLKVSPSTEPKYTKDGREVRNESFSRKHSLTRVFPLPILNILSYQPQAERVRLLCVCTSSPLSTLFSALPTLREEIFPMGTHGQTRSITPLYATLKRQWADRLTCEAPLPSTRAPRLDPFLLPSRFRRSRPDNLTLSELTSPLTRADSVGFSELCHGRHPLRHFPAFSAIPARPLLRVFRDN